MTMTVTESYVEERLKPQIQTTSPLKPTMKPSVPYTLMRSASFDRLRQFPTYFCRHGSAEIYRWLSSSKSKVYEAFFDAAQQLQRLLLIGSILGSVVYVGAQTAVCLFALTTAPLPFGLVFLLTCTLVIASLATQILLPWKSFVSPRKNRSLARRPRN